MRDHPAWCLVLCLFVPSGTTIGQEPSRAGDFSDAERAALEQLEEEYATTFELVDSWFAERQIQYYHFGVSSVRPGALYRVRGGGDVVSSVPGLPDYSALRQVYVVEPDSTVSAHTIRSHDQIARLAREGRARIVGPGITINAPIVPHGSTLANDPEARIHRGAWYQGRRVTYFDFGPNRVTAIELAAFISGFDAGGEPVFIDEQPSNASAIPGRADYSDLWAVTLAEVGASYRAGSYRDLGRVRADATGGRLTLHRRGTIVNCSVVYVDGRPAAR